MRSRTATREAEIALLADAVDPSPTREVCRRRMLEARLDESGLTLTGLRVMEKSFARTMMAVFHPRARYPEPVYRFTGPASRLGYEREFVGGRQNDL